MLFIGKPKRRTKMISIILGLFFTWNLCLYTRVRTHTHIYRNTQTHTHTQTLFLSHTNARKYRCSGGSKVSTEAYLIHTHNMSCSYEQNVHTKGEKTLQSDTSYSFLLRTQNTSYTKLTPYILYHYTLKTPHTPYMICSEENKRTLGQPKVNLLIDE